VRPLNRNFSAPVVLGLAALATNAILLFLLWGENPLPAGNIFLLCAAGALQPAYALMAAALGSFPIAFWTGDLFEAFRVTMLCVGLSYAAARAPKIPGFVLTALAWALCFIPLQLYWHGQNTEALNLKLAFGVCSETVFSMIAGALLLNTSVWGAITQRPRHVALSSLLAHFLAITASVVMLAMMSMQVRGALRLSDTTFTGSLYTVMVLTLLCVALPLYLGFRLARRIGVDSQEIIGLGHSLGRNTTTFTNIRRGRVEEPSSSSDFVPGSGKTEGALPAVAAKNLPSGISSELGICALNRNGTVSFVNRKFRQLAEMNNNEVLGKRLDSVDMNATLRTQILELIELTFAKGPRAIEVKLNKLPDKLRYYEISSRRPDELDNSSLGDGPDSVILTVKDITDRRTVESHLLQAQKLSALAPLLNNLAHSFNNTLTAIVGQASFALHVKDEARRFQALQSIIAASQEAGALVNKLLEFTTSQPGDMKTGDLRTVLNTRVDLLKKVVGAEYELIVACPETPLPVSCDANLVFQALTNLIANARESYQGKHGSIEITLAEEHLEPEAAEFVIGAKPGDYVRLRVKDLGCGMNAETMGKAFNPLYSTKRSTGHIGLGLSIVYSIVRAHDGFLAVESHPDKGTSVSLYFPKSKAQMAAEPHSGKHNKPRDINPALGTHERILVVEDEKNVRELVSNMLRLLGYDVVGCSGGQEALAANASQDFDLFLVDMVLPKIGGLQLIDQLRAQKPESRALVMTGFGYCPEVQAGKDPVIPKPFDIETLARAVRNSLGDLRNGHSNGNGQVRQKRVNEPRLNEL
jgi:signal transduction histidine kinase/ActR/RegA family two-component response regulator